MSLVKDQKSRKNDSRKTNPAKESWKDTIFHNIPLTRSDKDALDDFIVVCNHSFHNPLVPLVLNGYKVSVRYDEKNNSYMCSITGSEDSPNPNICVTSYSDLPDECIWIALYKAYDAREEKWYVWDVDAEKSNTRWG